MEILASVATRFRLQEVLDELGVSQRQLSLDSGVSPTTINRMCKNLTAQVSLATLDSIASTLNVEPADLLHYERDKKRKR